MSPIFVRPVREQLEHDRLIRFLQPKYKRKHETAINPGDEQIAPVKIGSATFFPDVVLTAGKKLAGLVEVESGESVNNLEAMAQWVHFSRARVPFHLYVPVPAYDVAKRLCEANQVRVAELWTYRPLIEGFDLVRVFTDPAAAGGGAHARHAARPKAPGKSHKPARSAKAGAARSKSSKGAKSSKSAKPAKSAKAKKPAGRASAKVARKPARSAGGRGR